MIFWRKIRKEDPVYEINQTNTVKFLRNQVFKIVEDTKEGSQESGNSKGIHWSNLIAEEIGTHNSSM